MSEGLYKALEAAHGPGQANQVSLLTGNVPLAIDSLQRCQPLSYRLSSSSVLCVLARLNACATPFQSVIIWELLCQAGSSRQLPVP